MIKKLQSRGAFLLSQKDIPEQIIKLCYTFKRWQLFWFSLHYFSGVIAVVAGVLATASAAESGPEFIINNTWLWGLLSAFLSGVVTFLSPLQKARDYKQAYYRLDSAMVRFQSHLLSATELLDEYEQAKHIVLFGEIKPTAAESE